MAKTAPPIGSAVFADARVGVHPQAFPSGGRGTDGECRWWMRCLITFSVPPTLYQDYLKYLSTLRQTRYLSLGFYISKPLCPT